MARPGSNSIGSRRGRPGIVLLVTLLLLVVLATLGYTLSVRVAAQRYRSQYVIDYQAARYGCDSAVKYALATLEDISPQLIGRPNEPDFSDLFYLTEEEYREVLEQWAEQKALEESEDIDANSDFYEDYSAGTNDLNDINDINGVNNIDYMNGFTDFNDPNLLVIPGPYGPPWPFVMNPAEFEIGSAKIRIEIEDENAKYPVGWMLVDDDNVQRETIAGFQTFCEWMDVNEVEIDELGAELKEIAKIKPFKIAFKPIKKREPIRRQPVRRTKSSGRGGSRRRPTRRTPSRYKTTTQSVSEQISKQAADLAKLLHSSLLDVELLARPIVMSETRKESALKYMGTWGSIKVNVNSAPRHVLEAAFMFGGDADKIAEEIIQRRRIEPFKDLDDLRKALFRYTQAVRDCEPYITTTSNFFTIRVTAVSGAAKASTVIAITKDIGEGVGLAAAAAESENKAKGKDNDNKGKKTNVVAIISS
ncbi:MAG: hypothetical protein ACYTBJ_09680 [Planctomycetota bacterium]